MHVAEILLIPPLDPTGKRALAVGACAAGAAVAAEQAMRGADLVSIFETDAVRADAIVQKLGRTLSRGAGDGKTPIGPAPLHPSIRVAELAMEACESPLLAAATGVGCTIGYGAAFTNFQMTSIVDFFMKE